MLKFDEIVAKMPKLMEELVASRARSWKDRKGLPEVGIYVFYDEKGDPIYVGRSNRISQRIAEHGRPSSTHNSAPFAFNLAREGVRNLPTGLSVTRRRELEVHPEFCHLFTVSKQRVQGFTYRVVEVQCPIEQTIFEVYAAMELGTANYNSFDNH